MKKTAVAILAAVMGLAGAAWADTSKGLPPDQVIAAIQAAIAVQPGNIKDVEVDDRRNNSAVVEVEIIAPDNRKHKVRIDAETRQVVR